MELTQKGRILKSESGKRMIETVSPIYENSYVGCWLYETMGREYDKLRSILSELPTQLFPETATWLLEMWERRYQLSGTGQITDRRSAIVLKRKLLRPLSPGELERVLSLACGCDAKVEDNVAPYTFGITVEGMPSDDVTGKIQKLLSTLKPSHLSCAISYEKSTEAQILAVGCFTYAKTNYTIGQVS